MADVLREVFPIAKDDYATAGNVSSDIKDLLKQMGFQPAILRRVATACYEAEINQIIHSDGGKLMLELNPDNVTLISEDVGPGIPDIDLAMSEGYSTASDDVRMMGFGAGMGLANMARNADHFNIESRVGEGTKIEMVFDIK